MAVVYGLVASDRPSEVRYVGQTVRTAAWRLKRHVEATHSKRGPMYPINHWIRAVEARGARVVAVELVSDAEWNTSETAEIRRLRATGADLLNCTDGGDGHAFVSAETRQRMSAASKGRPKTREHRRRISAGHKARLADPAAREELRLRHVGLKRSAATRAKLSGENNPMAKLTAATVVQMRAAYRSGHSVSAIADAHGCGYPACYAAVKGLTWQSL